jgi:hypothetical protein
MPLYALLDYTRARGDLASVDRYGIALLKRELFVAGARPVIYGLSRQHQESNIKCWPRMLHDSCGISEDEQYRYVAMNLKNEVAEEGAKQWRETHGRGDVFGFAYLMVDGSRTEVVEALLQLNEVNEIACSDGLGYRMANIGGSYETHLLGEAEAGVMAAKTYLERELSGTVFRMRTVWD